MRTALVIGLLLLSFVSENAAQQTAVNDTAAARRLLGRHMFSLQWVSWDRFGTARVVDRDGAYRIAAEQKNVGGDFVTMHGVITSIDEKEFAFLGKIVTRVSHINAGQPCTRDGEFVFRVTGKRKYWRLAQMDNPCDPVTDYVDIYFK